MIEAELARQLSSFPTARRIWVAYSGGLDSSALLHAVAQVKPPNVELSAIHVHHGLSVNADAWAEHCREVCQDLSLTCLVERVSLDLQGKSLEQVAREARYAVFAKYLCAGDVLLMAHHADDQAETVLMRLMRGGDSTLLSGIPQTRMLGAAAILRPFLGLDKSELERYLKERSLAWIQDESNFDDEITRNYIRNQVLPRLRAQRASISTDLCRIASLHQSLSALDSRLALSLIHLCSVSVYGGVCGIRLDVLASLSSVAQRALVRSWINIKGLPQPSTSIFERLWSELIAAPHDSQPLVQWGEVKARRYNEILFIDAELSQAAHPSSCGLKPLNAYPAAERVLGRYKKAWWKLFQIPPWCRDAILCVEEEGKPVALIDKYTGNRMNLAD